MQIVDGVPKPLGFSMQTTDQKGIVSSQKIANFAVFASRAERVSIGIFQRKQLINRFEMKRTDDIWHIGIVDLPECSEYAFCCEGGRENFYNANSWLIDPYAKRIREDKAQAAEIAEFDWGKDVPLKIPKEELVIYEMHIRGFTKHSSSKVEHPGTYLGIIEKIPYLKKLGINAIELMPIYDFDPYQMKIDFADQKKRTYYWGYEPIHFFFPARFYAEKDPILEFKQMVKELHANGIEVLLDVVYNHTAETQEHIYHLRGLDARSYYMIDHDAKFLNFTGCGNTIQANHPRVQEWILASLRYWAEEMHVDGFRFDLASVFTRAETGSFLEHSSILKAMAQDPVLSQKKLIAEPWDAGGFYQVGQFPSWGPWSEWNGKYRDTIRRFIKGTSNQAAPFASSLCGSEQVYTKSSPLSSINVITSHDGFTLHDLVSFNEKHNEANGENNRDGTDQNESWNCGVEGKTDDPKILELRERQMRNFLLALFVSQGIPMLFMGDEYGHTREGNNNPYAQDNELNWFLWDQIDRKKLEFLASLIDLRKKESAFKQTSFLKKEDVDWFCSFDERSKSIFYHLKKGSGFYIGFHSHFEAVKHTLPKEFSWELVIDTKEDWVFHKKGTPISEIELLPYSAFLAKRC